MEDGDPLGTSVEPMLQSDASVDVSKIGGGGETLKFQETDGPSE